MTNDGLLRHITGRRVGQASAREFAAVTSVAGAGALAFALAFSGAATAVSTPSTGPVASPKTTTAGSTTPSPGPSTSTATPTATPEEVTVTISEQVAVPFGSTSVDDATLLTGAKVVRTAGRAGVKTVTWLVRTRGGVEVSRTVSGEQVTTPAVDEVVAVGTAVPAPAPTARTTAQPVPKATSTPTPAPKTTTPPSTGTCDPNYAGACVPIASDVDCAGGSGNGPAYVRGPVQVVGRDIYGLDADHDGIGCE